MIETGNLKLALSPEFDQRLRDKFPSGTDENRLVEALTAQRFKLSGSCQDDPTIRIASYRDEGVLFLRFATAADVYWKADDQARIIWIKGFVSYTGL